MTLDASTPAAAHTITVDVVYNGLSKSLTLNPHETVRAALDQAMNAFGIRDQRHLMAFFRQDGTEVTPESISLQAAGIMDGTVLALRPSRVKGGN